MPSAKATARSSAVKGSAGSAVGVKVRRIASRTVRRTGVPAGRWPIGVQNFVARKTSSRTPFKVVNSCATPSILTEVTEAPSSEERRTRRRPLPTVVPKRPAPADCSL